jgi:hypothetical protein
MRRLDKTTLKIILSYGTNSNDIRGIFIKLYLPNNDIASNEIFISFDRLTSYFKRMMFNHTLRKDIHIRYYSNFETFLEKVFIHHCYSYISENIYHVGVLPRPVGVFCNESYSFQFLKTNCSIEFNILENENIVLFIFCRENDQQFIQIDIVIDDESFNLLFSIIDELRFHSHEEEKKVKQYNFVNTKQLNKNGIIPYILLRLQEILKFKYNNVELKFDEVASTNKDMVFKLQIEDKHTVLDFYILQYIGDYKWTVEFYALKKLEGIIFLTPSQFR